MILLRNNTTSGVKTMFTMFIWQRALTHPNFSSRFISTLVYWYTKQFCIFFERIRFPREPW